MDSLSPRLGQNRREQISEQRSSRGLGLPSTSNLEVRLARSSAEVRAAQALRFRVFYEEMSAVADSNHASHDVDSFDEVCDHLVVLDHDLVERVSGKKQPQIVGTYRLLRKEVADLHGGFYTAQRFNLDPLFEANPELRFLELGRSCVLPSHRTKGAVQLLWRGIWDYCLHQDIDVMLGCASLEGTDPDKLAPALAFLHHYARSPSWMAAPPSKDRIAMDRLAKENLNKRRALAALPPLIKGYLRLGAKFGDGAVVDRQFGTTMVLVVLPVASISERYVRHFEDRIQ